MPAEPVVADEFMIQLRSQAEGADGSDTWPDRSWHALAQAGAPRWAVPLDQGGLALDRHALLDGYLTVASACLTSSFILSQREAAVRRLLDSDRADLRSEVLPKLLSGAVYATVGLSQLTTSRQHGAPALRARLTDRSLVLDGTMPWVTGADTAGFVVCGAVLDDGRQVLAVLPTDTPGLSVGPPLPLMALRGSRTAEVACHEVVLDRHWLLAGPVEKVMSGGAGPGRLETSCLALGLARSAIDYLQEESKARGELRVPHDRLRHRWQQLHQQMHDLADDLGAADGFTELRGRANELVLDASQAALTAAKGAGFLIGHPAGRWARQALFFLVWSCPRPASEATLSYLTTGPVATDACPG